MINLRRLTQLPLFHFGSIKQFYLPDLGEKIKEATVKAWHVQEGDPVEEFQPVADVATDKLFTSIPSSYTGIVHRRFHEEDQECQVGELFLEIEVEDGEESEHDAARAQSKQTTQPITAPSHNAPQQDQTDKYILSSPAVRTFIKKQKLDITLIPGSGPKGKIIKQDVLDYMESLNAPNKKQQQQVVKKEVQQEVPVVGSSGQSQTVIKMSDYEKGMQKSMTESLGIPHFYLMEEIDLTRLRDTRAEVKRESGENVSYMPFLLKGFSQALLEYPQVNSLYSPQRPYEYQQMGDHNISIAIDSPQGLVVPNIKAVQTLSLLEIQHELNRLRSLAQEGRLGMKELTGGSVCLSNIGNIGGTYAGPLILPPQVCIVAVGKSQEVPRYQNGQVVPRLMTTVSFGCDHRVLNGATVTRFAQRWKRYLEQPSTLLMHMK